jgi:hypothetical protein
MAGIVTDGFRSWLAAAYGSEALGDMKKAQLDQLEAAFYSGIRWYSSEVIRTGFSPYIVVAVELDLKQWIEVYKTKHGITD